MRVLSTVAAAALLAAALLPAPEAAAQRNRNNGGGNGIVVVSYSRIASESQAGRDMTAKLQQLAAQFQQERQAMQPEAESIQQEDQRLSAQLRTMTAEQRRSNPQVQALGQRVQQLQQRQQALQGDAECTQFIALRDLQTQVEPVVRAQMQARGATAVVDTTYASVFDPNADITSAVIQALDSTTRTANVARHAVSECQGQRPAGQ